MGENKRHKRKSRHRAKAVLKYGKSAVRPHMRLAGRTGSVHAKRTPRSRCADIIDQLIDFSPTPSTEAMTKEVEG